jgi:hypothetical protein
MTTLSPTPPAPTTTTHSPGCTRASGERAERGREAASEGGRGGEGDVVGNAHEVGVGGVQRDALGERAPVREPGLLLVGAHLRVARAAPPACPAAADERHGHPVADGETLDARAGLDDHAGKLMARNVRHGDVVVTHPRVPVAAAQSGRPHLHDHAAGGRDRVIDLTHLQRRADGIHHHCTHPALSSPSR